MIRMNEKQRTNLQEIKNKKSKMIIEGGDPMEIAILEIEIAKQEIERGESLKSCANLESAIQFLGKARQYKFVRSGYVIGYHRAYFKEKRDEKE